MAPGLLLWRLLHHVLSARDLLPPLVCTSILQKTLPVVPKCGLDEPGQRRDPGPRGPRCSGRVAQCSKAQSSLDQSACPAAGLTHRLPSVTKDLVRKKKEKKTFTSFTLRKTGLET